MTEEVKKIIYKKNANPQFGICIDWETSGASWGKDSSIDHQGLSFGAVIFNTSTLEPVKTLYVEIKHDKKYVWSLDAERIHGLSQQYLEENGSSQEDAAILLAELILEYFGAGGKVMVMGHNAEFDISFTNQLMQTIGIEFSKEKKTKADGWIPLHHVLLDTSAVGFVTMGIFKSDLLFEAVGLEERKEHNALTDTLYTLETARRIRLLVQTALEG